MRASVPDMEPMRHSLLVKDATDELVVRPKRVVRPDHEHDIHLPQMLQSIWTIEPGKEVRGHVEVHRIVIIPIEQVPKGLNALGKVEATGTGHKLPKQMGMTKRNVGCVVGSKAQTVGNNTRMVVLSVHERKNFVQNVPLELNVSLYPATRMRPETIEALLIYAIHAKELEMAGFELEAQRMNNAEVLVLMETGGASRKNQSLRPGMAKDQEFHVPI